MWYESILIYICHLLYMKVKQKRNIPKLWIEINYIYVHPQEILFESDIRIHTGTNAFYIVERRNKITCELSI